jgi:hypothetical protein
MQTSRKRRRNRKKKKHTWTCTVIMFQNSKLRHLNNNLQQDRSMPQVSCHRKSYDAFRKFYNRPSRSL